jgi:membrane peptidoglycan carboxypeptidase
MKKFIWSLLCALIGAGFATAESLWEWGQEDFLRGQTLNLENLEFSVIITDKNGEELYRNFNQENREWINLEDIPLTLQLATIMAEDKRFYSHNGVDIKGIGRAAWQNHLAGSITQGGSTITQQLARKVFLNDERSYERKLKEMFTALGIESRYNKDEILEMYLNTVPYGPRTNGVAVAAEEYFSKTPLELTAAESLVLAVLPKDPVRLARKTEIEAWLGECPIAFVEDTCSPFKDLNYDFSRVESLLFAVAENLNWTPEEAHEVWVSLRDIELPQNRSWVNDDFQHFRFYLENFMAKNNLTTAELGDGVVIQTTLDKKLQQKFLSQLKTESAELQSKHWISNVATIVVDHKSRGPLVWIGSQDYWNQNIGGQVDMLESRRQTGSAIKPFIYAAAIDKGYQPPTIFYDSVVWFRNDRFRLSNSDGRFLGGIRMKQALAYSRNIPAAKAMLLAGGESAVKNYLDDRFGFSINSNYPDHFFGWTLALGTAPVKLSDLANAYATLGSNEKKELCPILSITTFKGDKVSHPCQIKITRRSNQTTNYFISEILSDESARPESWNKLIATTQPMAVKTGTSSKRVNGQVMPVDDLVVGYTPNATVLLWAGNTSGAALKPGSVAIFAVGKTWRDLANTMLAHDRTLAGTFKAPESLQNINGTLATLDYQPPGYENLNRFVGHNVEQGINPLYQLDHER